MRVRFWGVRGSASPSLTAATIRVKIERALRRALKAGITSEDDVPGFIRSLPFAIQGTYGTNTPCVEVDIGGEEYFVCDAGLGLRDFGNAVYAARSGSVGAVFHLVLSHMHWDHIQGLPFFLPAYQPGNRIIIYGCHENIEQALVQQQKAPFFPVPLYEVGALVEFVQLRPGETYLINNMEVTPLRQRHPGASYAYRLDCDGKRVVYATDCEHHLTPAGHDRSFVHFIKNSDLLILDAQYDFASSHTVKKDWGHSSNVVAVEMAKEAGVKRLCLFHHEPTDDKALDAFFYQTQSYAEIHKPDVALALCMAYDGLEVSI